MVLEMEKDWAPVSGPMWAREKAPDLEQEMASTWEEKMEAGLVQALALVSAKARARMSALVWAAGTAQALGAA